MLTVVATLVLVWIRISKPSAEELKPRSRCLARIVTQPRYLVAVLAAMVSYGVMNLMMVSTPLAIHAHDLAFHHVASVNK